MRLVALLGLLSTSLTFPTFALPGHHPSSPSLVEPYGQCGGIGYMGSTRCTDGYSCTKSSDWWSACRPSDSKGCSWQAWEACGGIGFEGNGCCMKGTKCVELSEFYSHCKPIELPTWTSPICSCPSTTTISSSTKTTSTRSTSTKTTSNKTTSSKTSSTKSTSTMKPTSSSSSITSKSTSSSSTRTSSSSSITTAPPSSSSSSSSGSASSTATQAPEPLPTITRKPQELRLSPKWDINAPPQERVYYFTIEAAQGAVDGFLRRDMLVINRQFPAPLIEANEGDTIVVHVNNLLNQPIALHWHGLAQNGTNWEDGPSGVTQCPIQQLQSYTYRFKAFRQGLDGQFGTYWYHAHRRALYTDGLVGPLIIHSPNDPLKRGVDYDIDQIILLTDWYHQNTTFITDALLSPGGLSGSFVAPSPNSVVVNGRGRYDCSFATSNDTCVDLPFDELTFPPDSRVRLRFIHAGAHPEFFVSVDEHSLDVIEVDDTAVEAASVHRIKINVAQRYSGVFNTTGASVGDSFFIRSTVNTACLGLPFDDLTLSGLIVARIDDGHGNAGVDLPDSLDWSDPIVEDCIDLDDSLLVPRIVIDAPTTASQFSVFNASFAVPDGVFHWTLNSVTFENFAFDPLLHQVARGQTINPNVSATIVAAQNEVLDIAIQNIQGADHPFHLHGVKMFLIGRGNGTIDQETASTLDLNLTNPIRRDTITVAPGTWSLVRVNADIPGVHAFHCHIVFHQSQGLMGVLVIEPSIIQTFDIPVDNLALCNGGNTSLVDPGRKKRSYDFESWQSRRALPAAAPSPVETGWTKMARKVVPFGF